MFSISSYLAWGVEEDKYRANVASAMLRNTDSSIAYFPPLYIPSRFPQCKTGCLPWAEVAIQPSATLFEDGMTVYHRVKLYGGAVRQDFENRYFCKGKKTCME